VSSDLLQRDVEDIVQYERDTLDPRQRVHYDRQCFGSRLREDRHILRFLVVVAGFRHPGFG